MEGLGINPSFLLSQIVNFLILFAALYFLLWKRVLSTLDARRQRIQEGLETAERAAEELARAEAAYSEKVAEGEAEAERIQAEARQGAGEARALVLEEAAVEAQQLLAEARVQADLERERMLKEVRDQVVALSIAAANRLIGETLDEQRQVAIVQEFFSGVKAGTVSVVDRTDVVSSGAVVVTSALPLDEQEQAQYRGALAERFGREVAVDFRTNPAILGGVIIQVGDRVVDDSMAGKLDSLKAELTAD